MLIKPAMNLEQVSPKKVSDFIFDRLEEAIILKEFMSDEQLPSERDLATIFNASRITVREALARLESLGLVEKRVGAKGGTFVLPITRNSHLRNRDEMRRNWDSMIEVFEYRMVVEPGAAYLAAQRIKKEELQQLRDYVTASIEPDCTREAFRSIDVRIHLSVAKASGNSYFDHAVRQIRTKINPALDLMPYSDRVKVNNYEAHRDLIAALEAGDADRSRDIMYRHIEHSAEAIRARVFADESFED